MPLDESGSDQFAPVASALTHVIGATIQVSASSPLPTFNSVNVPIDAIVSPKLKRKFWLTKFIDFGILLSSGYPVSLVR